MAGAGQVIAAVSEDDEEGKEFQVSDHRGSAGTDRVYVGDRESVIDSTHLSFRVKMGAPPEV